MARNFLGADTICEHLYLHRVVGAIMSARLRLWKSDDMSGLNLNANTAAQESDPVAAAIDQPTASFAISSGPTVVIEETSVQAERPASQSEQAVGGLHDILKATDFWFALEVGQLEKYAQGSASEHAKAGLPRIEAVAEEELEVEKVLRARACELFLEWTARVRRKVQDAIQSAAVNAGTGLVQLRGAVDQLVLTGYTLKETECRLLEAKNIPVSAPKTLEYGGLLHSWAYWAMFAALAAVDWIANIPVFGQLLPKDPGADQRLQDAIADAGQSVYLGGIKILLQKILSSVDVSVLALGVVIILMFLCHACGKNLRRVIAFRKEDGTFAELGLRSQRRQSWIPFGTTGTAITLAVVFLFMSRGKLEVVTKQRLDFANIKLQRVQEDQRVAISKGDPTEIQAASDQEVTAEKKVVGAESDHDYAQGVSGMNLPIGILNIVLVLTAVSASYLHAKGSIGGLAFIDSKISALQAKLVELRGEMVAQRTVLRGLDSSIQRSIAQANFLAQSLPLREWPAKARRLEAVVPLFRAENAQQRGIDVQNIRAFEVERLLGLAATREDEAFHIPLELRIWEAEFATLRRDLDRLQAETTILTSVEV
jgi:hypothetical protein